jgi:hypothetical protein
MLRALRISFALSLKIRMIHLNYTLFLNGLKYWMGEKYD